VEYDYFELFLKHLKEHCITAWKCRSGRRKLRTVCNVTARYWLKITTSSTLFFVRNALPTDTEERLHSSSYVRIIQDDLCAKCKAWDRNGWHENDDRWYPVLSNLSNYI